MSWVEIRSAVVRAVWRGAMPNVARKVMRCSRDLFDVTRYEALVAAKGGRL